MKYLATIVVIVSLLLTGNTIGHLGDPIFSTENDVDVKDDEAVRDLEDIRKDNILKVITTYSSTNYFLYKGRPMGYQYELMKKLAGSLDLNFEVVVAPDKSEALRMLNKGHGDIIAMGLTVNADNKERVQFTKPLKNTRYILIQKLPWNWHSMKLHEIEDIVIRDPYELANKEIFVRENSAHFDRLNNMEEELGVNFNIVTLPEYLSTNEILRGVDNGEYEYAVVDENQAKINKADFPNLDINTAISLPVRTAWAVRNSAPDLLDATNDWLDRMNNGLEFNVIYNKYYKNKRFYKRRVESEFYSLAGGKISPFDTLIKKNSGKYDWRFVASIIYQESQFKADTNSWVGAIGLMQLMPSTAKAYGVSNPGNPNENIAAGMDYLRYLMNYWKEIPDSLQRLKFSLASYNCGLAHVIDGQRLAEKYEDDSESWDGSVENYVRKLSQPQYFTDPVVKYGYCRGEEPYNYVKQIFDRYEHYREFIPTKNEEQLMTSVDDYKPVKVF